MQRKDENIKKVKEKIIERLNLKEIGRTFECLKKYFKRNFEPKIEKYKGLQN